MSILQDRYKIISNYIIEQIISENLINESSLLDALEILLNSDEKKYNFNIFKDMTTVKNSKKIEKNLSNFNEKNNNRRNIASYYTPADVTNYINLNTILMSLIDKNNQTYKDYKALNKILSFDDMTIRSLLFEKTFFDPTCGSGEFLVNALEIKIEILKNKSMINDENLINIAKTIYGNDINQEAIDIAMFRIFIGIAKHIEDNQSYHKLSKIIKKNFTTYDFVNYKNQIMHKFDFIIGNPPYIEYRNYKGKRHKDIKFGNVYADVIYNTFDLIANNGAFGYVLPISYASTNRMSKLREIVIEKFSTQFVLSFGDRPDCLFPGVHQKLNIVIAKKGKEEHSLYTSRYNIWRKDEREKLLNGCEIIKVYNGSPKYIPKIGNMIEESIFRKIRTVTNDNIYDNQEINGNEIYLNMRAAFWIKAFSFNPGSKEYKKFSFNENKVGFILSVLNSSLFWMFWTIVSDGWHITNKELKEFLIPKENINYKIFDDLYNRLEIKLEETKKFIGSKQTKYEYKHKECKDIIDEIDNELAKIYGLTKEELNYVKNFAISYRMGEKNE